VASERIRLDVQERATRGSSETRRLRKQGLIPGVLYGRTTKPRAICINERELRRALTGDHGVHAVLDVVVDGSGKGQPSIVKAFQKDPVKGFLTHIDLHAVRLDEPIQTAVVVHLVGDAPGVRAGGVLAQVLSELHVEALPLEVPEHIDVEIGAMELDDTFRVGDVAAPKGVTILDDPDTVVATLTRPTPVVEPEEELEAIEEAAAEGEVPAGEAAAEQEATGSEGTVPG
jgi:large subunit ribosomal protein L25